MCGFFFFFFFFNVVVFLVCLFVVIVAVFCFVVVVGFLWTGLIRSSLISFMVSVDVKNQERRWAVISSQSTTGLGANTQHK